MLGCEQVCPDPAWLLTEPVACRFLQPWGFDAVFSLLLVYPPARHQHGETVNNTCITAQIYGERRESVQTQVNLSVHFKTFSLKFCVKCSCFKFFYFERFQEYTIEKIVQWKLLYTRPWIQQLSRFCHICCLFLKKYPFEVC